MTSERDRDEVIVADDDLLFSSRLSGALVRMGYRPVVAATAAAVDAAVRDGSHERSLRAVILNLAARGFDATQAIRRIKGDGTTGRIPLLGFCGHRDAARAEAAKAAGCDAVTTNGVIAADLERVLKPLLEPIAPPAGGT
jgi:CheY-like chemotaxis protein